MSFVHGVHHGSRFRLVVTLVAAVTAALAIVGGVVNTYGPPERESTGSGATIGCAPLSFSLRQLAADRGALVRARGVLTGVDKRVDEVRYAQMRLIGVTRLAGARVRPRVVWLRVTQNAVPAGVPGLWARDGELVAIVTRQEGRSKPFTARVAPVVGDRAVLSAAGCMSWDGPGADATPVGDRTFQEVPGSRSIAIAREYGGFVSVPIADLVRIARS